MFLQFLHYRSGAFTFEINDFKRKKKNRIQNLADKNSNEKKNKKIPSFLVVKILYYGSTAGAYFRTRAILILLFIIILGVTKYEHEKRVENRIFRHFYYFTARFFFF